MNDEPKIVVNGQTLNEAQAMTIRVACTSMLVSTESEGLGGDEHGHIMANLYIKRLREVLSAMNK